MKKKMILLILFMLGSVIGTLFIIKYRENKNIKEPYEHLTYLGTEEEYGDELNLSYYAETGGEFEDTEGFTDFVLLYNTVELAENNFDVYGIASLDDYLLRYLTYYLGEGLYEVEIEENSYKDDANYPSFNAVVHGDNSYIIHCVYRIKEMRYSFRCKEIENRNQNEGL